MREPPTTATRRGEDPTSMRILRWKQVGLLPLECQHPLGPATARTAWSRERHERTRQLPPRLPARFAVNSAVRGSAAGQQPGAGRDDARQYRGRRPPRSRAARGRRRRRQLLPDVLAVRPRGADVHLADRRPCLWRRPRRGSGHALSPGRLARADARRAAGRRARLRQAAARLVRHRCARDPARGGLRLRDVLRHARDARVSRAPLHHRGNRMDPAGDLHRGSRARDQHPRQLALHPRRTRHSLAGRARLRHGDRARLLGDAGNHAPVPAQASPSTGDSACSSASTPRTAARSATSSRSACRSRARSSPRARCLPSRPS